MAEMKNIQGIVFDVQSFSVHDGPGIRTLIFLKGCPLKCMWCANPEGQRLFPEIRYHKQNCRGCLMCAEACPKQAITAAANPQPGSAMINIDRTKCESCIEMECKDACPYNAMQITGKLMSVTDIMKIVQRDRPYFRNDGGVTLSGGDPFVQSDFALEILKACHSEYVHTAVESSMFLHFDLLEKYIPYIDFYLCDIKHMDSEKHKELTGVPNELILHNIAKLAKIDSSKVLIRVPVITGCNDDEENMVETARFAKENGLTRINLLPYHKLGIVKYEQLGKEYLMPEVETPDQEKMEHLRQVIQDQGVTCVVG